MGEKFEHAGRRPGRRVGQGKRCPGGAYIVRMTSDNQAVEEGHRILSAGDRKDPTYTLVYTGLSGCYGGLAAFGFVLPKETYPRAKDAALKALE
jgi:hypothetical protein